jgi:RNA polymerase-binding transcription factor DksA
LSDAREALIAAQLAASAQRDELAADLKSVVDGSTDVATDDEHDPEGATIAYERSRLSTLITQAGEHLAEIQAALDRIVDGTFGRCERCGEPIAEERLHALPSTRVCRDCAEPSRTR